MFRYNGKIQKIIDCVDIANGIFNKSDIYKSISNYGAFDMADCDSNKIAMLMSNTYQIIEIEVNVYRPKWRWSKAIGYYSSSNPHNININYYKINTLSNAQIVGNFAHELVHLADNLSEFNFGHGSNSSKGKEKTAPYYIGNIVSKAYGGIETEPEFKNYVSLSWWQRIIQWIF